jgi:hypothetical protein
MIKIVAETSMGATLFLGLERANTDRLHADMPIGIDVQELLAATSGVKSVERIVLIAGETLEDVYHQLRRGGLPLAATMPDLGGPDA